MSAGDCFSSGGWSGDVKRVFVSAPDEASPSVARLDSGYSRTESDARKSSAFGHANGDNSSSRGGGSYNIGGATKFAEVKNGPPGIGLKVVVELRDDCGEPRPQGGPIHFFPKSASEESDCFADQQRMAASFGMYVF